MFAVCLLLAVFQDALPDETVLTRSGRRWTGSVSHVAGVVEVRTPTGVQRIPEADLLLRFRDVRHPITRAEEGLQEAKRHFEEAGRLPETHPLRHQKHLLAIEIAQTSARTLQALEPHYGSAHPTLARRIQVMMQFIRLCRGSASSERAGEASATGPARIAIEDPSFAFEAPEAGEMPWTVLEDDLGPDLKAIEESLGDPDESKRLEALRRLLHPPSPLSEAALLRLLETERSPALLQDLRGGLPGTDPVRLLRALQWMDRETDPLRRRVGMELARSTGERAAFDAILSWFTQSPPSSHVDRALYASAFRQFRAWSVQALKELLTRNRNPRLQTEIIRQFGAVGDKAAGPMLLKTLDAFPRDSAASLSRLGRPAVPTFVEGARSNHPETRRICQHFLRKATGLRSLNLPPFEDWWKTHAKEVLEEERARWAAEADRGWTVDPDVFKVYDLPLQSIVP
jgi:hypothetical protein